MSEIRFTVIAEREKEHLRQLLPQKVGEPLDRDRVHDSVNVLFNTGLFADIKVEAEKADDGQVILTFALVSNYFIGSVSVEGESGRPSANQIISATKFQLGEVYSPEKLERARKNILQLPLRSTLIPKPARWTLFFASRRVLRRRLGTST